MKLHVPLLLLLSGCASFLYDPPGMTWVAACKRGPAYHTATELICDDESGTPFVSRPLQPNDNAGSACVFCNGWRF